MLWQAMDFWCWYDFKGQMQDCLHGHELHINSALEDQVAVQVHIPSFKACFSIPLCIMNNTLCEEGTAAASMQPISNSTSSCCTNCIPIRLCHILRKLAEGYIYINVAPRPFVQASHSWGAQFTLTHIYLQA